MAPAGNSRERDQNPMSDSSDRAYVRFTEVQKSYDGEELVIKNLNLDIDRG